MTSTKSDAPSAGIRSRLIPSRLLGGGLLSAETSREGDRATTLELFFDLVYAFAFTQVTALMVHHETAGGVLQGIVILLLLWGPWASWSWLTNQAHADRGIVRVGLIAATLIMFFASLAVPTAYRGGSDPLLGAMLFAIAYALVQVVHMTAYFVAAGSDTGLRRQIIITESSAFLPTVALLVIGGLVGAPFQVWIWLVAVTFQWVMIYVTSSGGDWRIKSAAHFAERHGLVVLLALGESVVAIGSGVARLPLSGMVLVGSGLGLGIGLGLWWAYFHHAAPRIEAAVARENGVKRSELATQVYTYLHFPLIAGIVIVAVGIETSVGHVADAVPPGLFSAVALGGGAALYLATTGFTWVRVSGEWALLRFVAATLLVIAIPLLAVVPAVVALAIVFVIVVGLAVAEGILGQRAKVPSKKAVAPASTSSATSE